MVNAQGSDKDWYLTSWNKYTNTQTHGISNLQNFREISSNVCILIWLNSCIKNQIFISQKLIFLKR